MGRGLSYRCSKCGKTYYANTGIGFMFPEVYKETHSDVKSGKYGEDWKELALSGELIAVDAELYLYVCRKCGHWEVEPDLSLYAPNDPEALKKKEYGIKTVEEWGEVPYVMGDDLESDYHILKRYVHKCKKCNDDMHRAAEDEKNSLPCPNCGGTPDKSNPEIVMWD